ncbi:MAG: hypothetical protein KGJ13_08425 [Patescibacteria group bacterium]|nr:hypothetical protein [Patescibacteria group bacterium]
MAKHFEENEITEMWRDIHRAQQEKRASNRENGAAQLTALGIPFESKNNGAHFRLGTLRRSTTLREFVDFYKNQCAYMTHKRFPYFPFEELP